MFKEGDKVWVMLASPREGDVLEYLPDNYGGRYRIKYVDGYNHIGIPVTDIVFATERDCWTYEETRLKEQLRRVEKRINELDGKPPEWGNDCKWLYADWCHKPPEEDEDDRMEKCNWDCYGKQEDCPCYEPAKNEQDEERKKCITRKK